MQKKQVNFFTWSYLLTFFTWNWQSLHSVTDLEQYKCSMSKVVRFVFGNPCEDITGYLISGALLFTVALEKFYLFCQITSDPGQYTRVCLYRHHPSQWNWKQVKLEITTVSFDIKYACIYNFTFFYYSQKFPLIAFIFFAKYPNVYSFQWFPSRSRSLCLQRHRQNISIV